MIDHINKVEIQGLVGSVRLLRLSDKLVARMAVATNRMYKDTDGCIVEETTWHNVSLWEGDGVSKETLESIAKYDAIHIEGRLRTLRYTDANESDRSVVEIQAYKFNKVEEV